MTDDDIKLEKPSRWVAWTVALVIALPIMYVLSAGPILGLLKWAGILRSPWTVKFLAIYQPLNWLYFHSSTFHHFSDVYLGLFGVP